MIPFQMGSSEELEDRATQHQGESMWLFDEVAFWHCALVLFPVQHPTLFDNYPQLLSFRLGVTSITCKSTQTKCLISYTASVNRKGSFQYELGRLAPGLRLKRLARPLPCYPWFSCARREGAGLAPYGVYRDLGVSSPALMSFVLRSQSVFVVTIVFFDCQQLRSHSHVAC